MVRPRTVLSFVLVALFVLSTGAATLTVSGEFSSKKNGSAAKHQYEPPGCKRGKGKKKGCDRRPCRGRGKRSYAKGRRCKIRGTRKRDRIRGSSHPDRVRAGRGNDRIFVRGGGKDYIRCGPGRDTVYADKRDRVSKDCERVIRR